MAIRNFGSYSVGIRNWYQAIGTQLWDISTITFQDSKLCSKDHASWSLWGSRTVQELMGPWSGPPSCRGFAVMLIPPSLVCHEKFPCSFVCVRESIYIYGYSRNLQRFHTQCLWPPSETHGTGLPPLRGMWSCWWTSCRRGRFIVGPSMWYPGWTMVLAPVVCWYMLMLLFLCAPLSYHFGCCLLMLIIVPWLTRISWVLSIAYARGSQPCNGNCTSN